MLLSAFGECVTHCQKSLNGSKAHRRSCDFLKNNEMTILNDTPTADIINEYVQKCQE